MLKLLGYLRANGFKTYIVSGGWNGRKFQDAGAALLRARRRGEVPRGLGSCLHFAVSGVTVQA